MNDSVCQEHFGESDVTLFSLFSCVMLCGSKYVTLIIHTNVSLVVDGFRFKRCDSTLKEDNLAEDLVVDEETYGCVKSFCYPRNTFNGVGGVVLAATARNRN